MMVSLALPSRIRRRIDRWIETHNPPDRNHIDLHNRRLYILPTRFGYLFAVMLLGLFIAAINYQNSMGFVLVFMLTALAIISLWQTHKNLLGVSIKIKTPRPVFCGETCELPLEISHDNNQHRHALGFQYQQLMPIYAHLGPGESTTINLKIPTSRRGQFQPTGITLFTRYPTGLFHAWGWLRFETPILVYPRPAQNPPVYQALSEQHDGKVTANTIEGEDFAGLREHRQGESLRHVSWKAYAQGKGLLTKTFEGYAQPSLWIDWDEINIVDPEEKLRVMCALVVEADREQRKYGIRLPNTSIALDEGIHHRAACLHALATFRQPDFNSELKVEDEPE